MPERVSLPEQVIQTRGVWLLAACALLLRWGFILLHGQVGWQVEWDAGIFLTLAKNLDHGVFTMFHPLDIPDTTRMPGYPAFLRIMQDFRAALVLQAVLSALKIPLVFILARNAGIASAWAMAAAITMAVEPMDIVLSGSILSESLFTTCILAAVVLLSQGRELRQLLPAALMFACAGWLRPFGLHLLLLTGSMLLFLSPKGLRKGAIVIGAGLLLLSPWAVRNQHHFGRPFLSQSGTVVSAYFMVPQVLRAAGDPRGDDFQEELRTRANAVDWTDPREYATFHSELRRDIVETLTAYPLVWARVHAVNTARVLLAPGRGHVAVFFQGASAWVVTGLSMAIVIVVLCGLLALPFVRSPMPPTIRMLLVLTTFVLLAGGLSSTDARFRNPATPLLLVAAAWGAQGIAARFDRREASEAALKKDKARE